MTYLFLSKLEIYRELLNLLREVIKKEKTWYFGW